MKRYIGMVLTILVTITLSVLGFVLGGVNLSTTQLETLKILGIICGGSALYCFVVGELSRNNSQMDKLWSLLPIAYTWVIAAMSNFNTRSLFIAIVVTLWGIRLTFNFARKGAYSIKFWTGEEDYRWILLRKKKGFDNRFVWATFDFFFISIYQNALVLAICLPSLAVMDSTTAINAWDILAMVFSVLFLVVETIADEEQWVFQETKKKLLKEGKTLEELEEPYRKGFNTTGLWGFMRHPNYLGEQGIWMSFILFTIGAGVCNYGIFNWTMFGPLFLVFLFLGSSTLGESISASKYPEYKYYVGTVFKYLPIRKYNYEKAKAKLD